MKTNAADRELLELAAKAAGMHTGGWALDVSKGMRLQDDFNDFLGFWNPLTDDGDALRLAVKLGMASERGPFDGEFYAHAVPPTRRAIVRAAAEIGKVSHEEASS